MAFARQSVDAFRREALHHLAILTIVEAEVTQGDELVALALATFTS